MICSTIPSQKMGIDTAAIEKKRMRWSGSRFFIKPAMTPSGSPMTATSSSAAQVSSTVAGKNWRRSSRTGRRVVIDVPRLP